MSTIISCRTGVFGGVETALEYLPKAGIFHAEAPLPADNDYSGLAELAARNGVNIASVSAQLNVGSEEGLRTFRDVVDGLQSIRVPRAFVSAKTGEDQPRSAVIERLSQLAEYAYERNVTICMETHPPLGTNGAIARRTLEDVGHPGMRFNFDTANIYYYNEGTDTITELKKVSEYVGSVHLKDTDGGFKSPHFPPLGQGVVDFASVFEILTGEGFSGPYTLEVEGANVQGLDTQGRMQFLRDCMSFLRALEVVR